MAVSEKAGSFLTSATALPLFAWRDLAEIEAERTELKRRIKLLRPHSHRRLELQARLKDLTSRELKCEVQK